MRTETKDALKAIFILIPTALLFYFGAYRSFQTDPLPPEEPIVHRYDDPIYRVLDASRAERRRRAEEKAASKPLQGIGLLIAGTVDLATLIILLRTSRSS
jgi:hypothetical protein